MHLTKTERLLVDRRRKGRTQAQTARSLNVPVSRYVGWESGRLPFSGNAPKIGRLEPNEKCLLYRRRCNKTQGEVANDMGFSKYWIRLMEQGNAPCDDLLWYWEQ